MILLETRSSMGVPKKNDAVLKEPAVDIPLPGPAMGLLIDPEIFRGEVNQSGVLIRSAPFHLFVITMSMIFMLAIVGRDILVHGRHVNQVRRKSRTLSCRIRRASAARRFGS